MAGAVAVHRGDEDLAGARAPAHRRPTPRRLCPSPWRPPWVKTSHPRSLPGADGRRWRPRTHCDAELVGQLGDQSGSRIAAVFSATLSAPARSNRRASSGARTPPPTVNGMNTSRRGPGHHVDHGVAAVRRGGDVEEDELVRTLGVIAGGQLHRVSGVDRDRGTARPSPPARRRRRDRGSPGRHARRDRLLHGHRTLDQGGADDGAGQSVRSRRRRLRFERGQCREVGHRERTPPEATTGCDVGSRRSAPARRGRDRRASRPDRWP